MAMHRYPTRWRLARQTPLPSVSQAHGVENNSKDEAVVDCKRRKQERHIQNLPVEILFDILILLPPEVLHDVVRYVCKHWYHILVDPNFITAHAHRESSSRGGGLLLQDPMKPRRATYVEEDASELKVTNIDLPSSYRIMGSRNGILLIHDLTGKPDVLQLVNPVTKAKFSLPPLQGLDDFAGCTCLAVTFSGHYKVVNITGELGSKQAQMRVFTVGIDKVWKFIDLQLQMERTVADLFPLRPCVTDEKLVYWYCFIRFFGFALNIDDETVYQFRSPKDDFIYVFHETYFIRLGTGLGVVRVEEDTWKVWELTDVISGNWTKVAEFHNMIAEMSRVDRSVYPRKCRFVCPLRFVDGYFWFQRVLRQAEDDRAIVCYNVSDKSFKVFMMRSRTLSMSSVLHPHVPTLLSPKMFPIQFH